MIRSLAEGASDRGHASVVVLGGGLAGLALAAWLHERGVDVLVLESGDEGRSPTAEALNAVVQVGLPYRGATDGRRRVLGGTSTIWGGAMAPFQPCDLEAHTAGWPARWPISLETLAPHFAAVEALFHLPAGGFVLDDADPDFVMRSAKWPGFSRRNVADALRDRLARPDFPVITDATVTKIELGETGRVVRLDAASRGGPAISVRCDELVIAAGAIETTRLLLDLQRRQRGALFAASGALGRYLQDHLSAPVARIVPKSAAALNRAFALRFARGGMRDVRIEPSEALRHRRALPGAFAHVAFEAPGPTGFSALRDILRDLQGRRGPRAADVAALARDLPWLARASWWRFGQRQLLAPRGAEAALTLVLEQYPNPESCIRLSADQRDRFGMPLAELDWRLHDVDFTNFEALREELTQFWSRRFDNLGELDPLAAYELRTRLKSGADVFHPVGTTRMAATAGAGVVDANLTTFDIPNLHVVSTSTFPTGGGANPSFTLLALAHRKAGELANRVGRAVSPGSGRANG